MAPITVVVLDGMSLGTMHRRTIAVLTVLAFVASGCTKTVQVPVDQVGQGSQDVKTPHRIHMADGSEYSVRQFVVSDTTLTIQSLNTTDSRYQTASMPIVLPLRDVRSIEKAEAGIGGFAFVALIGLACVALFVPIAWGMN